MSEKMELLEDIKAEIMSEMDDVIYKDMVQKFDFDDFCDRLRINPEFQELVTKLAKEYILERTEELKRDAEFEKWLDAKDYASNFEYDEPEED